MSTPLIYTQNFSSCVSLCTIWDKLGLSYIVFESFKKVFEAFRQLTCRQKIRDTKEFLLMDSSHAATASGGDLLDYYIEEDDSPGAGNGGK